MKKSFITSGPDSFFMIDTGLHSCSSSVFFFCYYRWLLVSTCNKGKNAFILFQTLLCKSTVHDRILSEDLVLSEAMQSK